MAPRRPAEGDSRRSRLLCSRSGTRQGIFSSPRRFLEAAPRQARAKNVRTPTAGQPMRECAHSFTSSFVAQATSSANIPPMPNVALCRRSSQYRVLTSPSKLKSCVWAVRATSLGAFAKRVAFDFSSAKSFALISSEPWIYKFTIDISWAPWYPFACYLEETSHTALSTPALTLGPSISCSLFVLFLHAPSFVFNSLQPLFPKHPGWGIPDEALPLKSATYKLFRGAPVCNSVTPAPRCRVQDYTPPTTRYHFPCPLFSQSCKSLFPQALCFLIHTKHRGCVTTPNPSLQDVRS
jgi:hypothetical protein